MRKIQKAKNGISLIVLIITIVVIIILATAVILSLNSSNILEKAKQAKEENNTKVLKEAVELLYAEYKLELEVGNTNKSAEEYVKSKLKESGFSDAEIGQVLITTEGKRIIFNYPKIPKGFVVSGVDSENNVCNGLVIYEGNQPVTSANHEEAMENRNQYVWIPVQNINEFVLEDGYDSGKIQTDYTVKYIKEPYIPSNLNSLTEIEKSNVQYEQTEYESMKKSVEKYGGFYIARYEAGDGDAVEARTAPTPARAVVSMKNQFPYNWVPVGETRKKIEPFKYTETIGTETIEVENVAGTIYLSRNIYKRDENYDVVSTLVYGVQWDAALRFISIVDPHFSRDNRNKGYYGLKDWLEGEEYKYERENPSNAQKTGYYKINNIYDLAGNVSEYTMETYSGLCIFRGGNFTNGGIGTPVSKRMSVVAASAAQERYGFRIALYLK